MSRIFAYCRVSTDNQTTDNQVREIREAGFAIEERRTVCEVVSGSQAASSRPGFSRLVDKLEAGDVLVVTKLDRLGRSALDVRQTVEKLAGFGVRVHCLALGGVDLTSAAGRMTMQVLAAVAEFELDLLKERTRSGLDRARSEGKPLGRPCVLTPDHVEEIKRLIDQPKQTVAALARRYNVSRASILRAAGRL